MIVDVATLIAPIFFDEFCDILEEKYTYYWNSGGRSSTKSSFISLVIVYGMMLDYSNKEISHAIVFRKVANTIADSVFEQLLWAIDRLGVSEYWEIRKSPYSLTYKPSLQKIYFRGLDEPQKIKSIKVRTGHFKYIWFEELAEFKNMEEIKTTYLSLFRKNTVDKAHFNVFMSYNPPDDPKSWVNVEAKIQRTDFSRMHTTYLDVPREWLTDAFLEDAEQTRLTNPKKYNHDFLGLVTGVDGLVYPMFSRETHVIHKIEDKERVYSIICGMDEGTTNDSTTVVPFCLTTKARIITPPTFKYDPLAKGHEILGHNEQAILILDYLKNLCNLVNYRDNLGHMGSVVIYGDSAESCQQLMIRCNQLAAEYGLPFSFISVGKKDTFADMTLARSVLSIKGFWNLLQGDYIDPVSKRKMVELDYRVTENIDPLVVEFETLIIDEKTRKPVDGFDHSIDAFKYGCKGLQQQGVI